MRFRVALGVMTTLVVGAASTVAAEVAVAASTTPALTYVPSPAWWGTNGRVNDIETVGSRVYVAGGFDYVGPQPVTEWR